MNIYKVWRDEPIYYDEWDAIIVAAPDVITAVRINPRGIIYTTDDQFKNWSDSWCHDKNNLLVQLIGQADPSIKMGVILTAYNAG